jgi:hypothetical protein
MGSQRTFIVILNEIDFQHKLNLVISKVVSRIAIEI